MKVFKNLTSFAPLLGAVTMATCVGGSLSGYVAPVFEPIEVQAEEVAEKEKGKEETKEVVQGNFDLEDGIYEGTGTGFAGKIKVAVEIKDKTMISIEILDASADDAAFVSRAMGVIDKMIASQSLDVDVVSGATYSSNGIIAAVKNALTGEVDENETAPVITGQGSTSVSTVVEASEYKDGTYYGTGTGFGGVTKVQVVISGGKITDISIISTQDDSSYIQSASSIIAKMIAGQTTNVDTVSGATYSSVGIIEAVRNALSQAAVSSMPSTPVTDIPDDDISKEETPIVEGNFPYNDGVYYGIGEGFNNDVKVAVEIKNKTIVSIQIVEHDDDAAFMSRAEKILDKVVSGQTIEVDVVSGATYSSNGILDALKAALDEAEKATNGDATKEPEKDDTDESEKDDTNESEKDDTNESEKDDTNESEKDDTNESEKDESKDEIEGEKETYKDGEYEIIVLCEPDEDEDFEAYNLTLKVKIEKDKIVEITDVVGDGDEKNDKYIGWAINGRSTYVGVVTQILEKGIFKEAEDIDVVSRATCTSDSIIKACLEALDQAKVVIEGE